MAEKSSVSLVEIAQELKNSNKKVQLIYAFNGSGKTRLSREFKQLISNNEENEALKIIYYNAFTEDLFHWDNDLDNDVEPKLKIQPNSFTNWILKKQGKDTDVVKNFQHYTDEKLTPFFNQEFSEVRFSFQRGNDEIEENIKISKGEESNFIWSVFYSLLEEIIEVLNVLDKEYRETERFDDLEYIFIDDPVSSLDENHLIELAVDLSQLIKKSESNIKFIITTHNPLFFNVLSNEFQSYCRRNKWQKYRLEKGEDGLYNLKNQSGDSPFSYHLFLKSELEKAIETGRIYKYHYNFLRNILEKTSTFLGYSKWGDLLSKFSGSKEAYEKRIINISSHSKHSGEEIADLTENDKRVLKFLLEQLNEKYNFKKESNETNS